MPAASTIYLPGPSGKIMLLSRESLHSSQQPYEAPLPAPSLPSREPYQSSIIQQSSKSLALQSRSQLPSPLDINQQAVQSANSIISNLSSTYQRIPTDQVMTALQDACSNLSLLYVSYSFHSKDSQPLILLQDIKEQFQQRKPDIETNIEAVFVGKWLWAFYSALGNFNETIYKLREGFSSVTSLFTTNSARKEKIESKLKSIVLSWQELIVNLSLAVSSSSAPASVPVQEKTVQAILEPTQLSLLGYKHLFGYGVPKSYDLAFKYFQSAHKRGSAESTNMLGCMYEQGLGQAVNLDQAMQLYKQAAENGLSDGMNNVGRLFERQGNCQQLAIDYYAKAAKIGHVDAMVSLGYFFEHGYGCQRDLDKAEEWYALASAKQYARAQNCLGSLLYKKRKPHTDDQDREAVRYFQMAAKQGNAHALNNLGICYEEGRGVDVKDLTLAKENYLKSAELKHASGANNLAFLLLCENKFKEAFKWFNIAMALGSVDALYNLGTMCESGVMHPEKQKDLVMAKYYYEEAVRKGCDKAKLRLMDLSSKSQ